MQKAAAMLQHMPKVSARPFAVYVGNREVWRYEADADAEVRWDDTRGILFIDEPGALDDTAVVAAKPVGRKKSAAAKKKVSKPETATTTKRAGAIRRR